MYYFRFSKSPHKLSILETNHTNCAEIYATYDEITALVNYRKRRLICLIQPYANKSFFVLLRFSIQQIDSRHKLAYQIRKLRIILTNY